MKKLSNKYLTTAAITILFSSTNYAFSDTLCPQPREHAATAFKLIENPSTGSLQEYLEGHIVSKTAKNEKCEMMYLVAIRTKNEAARKYLDQIGFGPENTQELNEVDGKISSSIFSYALQYSTLEVIEEYRKKGGKLDHSLGTELMIASRHNTLSVIKALVDAGSDSEAIDLHTKLRPIHFAALYNKNKDVFEFFIRKGIDINATVNQWDKRTLLMLASRRNSPEIVDLLIKAGANIHASDWGATALTYAATRKDGEKIASLLLAAGANVNGGEGSSMTPLDKASQSGSKEVVQLLLNAGAEIDHAPLYFAATSQDDIEVFKILLRAGADIGASLVTAAILQPKEVIELLIKAGADINALDGFGKTALIQAASNNSKEVIEYLLQVGADKKIKDENGSTAYDRAVQMKRPSAIIKLLRI